MGKKSNKKRNKHVTLWDAILQLKKDLKHTSEIQRLEGIAIRRRISALEGTVDELMQTQDRHIQQISDLEGTVDGLAETQDRHSGLIAENLNEERNSTHALHCRIRDLEIKTRASEKADNASMAEALAAHVTKEIAGVNESGTASMYRLADYIANEIPEVPGLICEEAGSIAIGLLKKYRLALKRIEWELREPASPYKLSGAAAFLIAKRALGGKEDNDECC